MNIIEPKESMPRYVFPLYYGGTIEFGSSTFGKGQRVGTPPYMCRILGKEPYIPSGWFVIEGSPHKASINLKRGFLNILPIEMQLACFRYHWQKLYNEKTYG